MILYLSFNTNTSIKDLKININFLKLYDRTNNNQLIIEKQQNNNFIDDDGYWFEVDFKKEENRKFIKNSICDYFKNCEFQLIADSVFEYKGKPIIFDTLTITWDKNNLHSCEKILEHRY